MTIYSPVNVKGLRSAAVNAAPPCYFICNHRDIQYPEKHKTSVFCLRTKHIATTQLAPSLVFTLIYIIHLVAYRRYNMPVARQHELNVPGRATALATARRMLMVLAHRRSRIMLTVRESTAVRAEERVHLRLQMSKSGALLSIGVTGIPHTICIATLSLQVIIRRFSSRNVPLCLTY